MPDYTGPLPDEAYLRITLANPLFAEDGPYMVVRWTEPTVDQVRHYRWRQRADHETISEWCQTIVLGHLNSNGSGVRRALAALERTSAIITG